MALSYKSLSPVTSVPTRVRREETGRKQEAAAMAAGLIWSLSRGSSSHRSWQGQSKTLGSSSEASTAYTVT